MFLYARLYFLSMAQPDSPAELGNKIYEMMAIALGGRWGRLDAEGPMDDDSTTVSNAGSIESMDAEVVEPSEVRTEKDPWSS